MIPVLIDGARMPKSSELPDPLMPLVRRHAFELRHRHFGRDADALIARIEEAPISKHSWVKRRLVAGARAVLLLFGWIGLYGVSIPSSVRSALQLDRIWSIAPNAEDHIVKAVPDEEAAARAEQAERERLAVIKADQDRKAKAAATGPQRGNDIPPKIDGAYFAEQLANAGTDQLKLMALRNRCIASSECSLDVLKLINGRLANTNVAHSMATIPTPLSPSPEAPRPEREVPFKLSKTFLTEQLANAGNDQLELMTLRDRCIASSECSVDVLNLINAALAK